MPHCTEYLPDTLKINKYRDIFWKIFYIRMKAEAD